MEDGGVDTTSYRKSAAQDGLNGRLSSTFGFFIFLLINHDVPQFKSQTMQQALMNLVNTTLFQKYLDPLN